MCLAEIHKLIWLYQGQICSKNDHYGPSYNHTIFSTAVKMGRKPPSSNFYRSWSSLKQLYAFQSRLFSWQKRFFEFYIMDEYTIYNTIKMNLSMTYSYSRHFCYWPPANSFFTMSKNDINHLFLVKGHVKSWSDIVCHFYQN